MKRQPPEPAFALEDFLRAYLPAPPVLPQRKVRQRRDGSRYTITWRTGLRACLDPYKH